MLTITATASSIGVSLIRVSAKGTTVQVSLMDETAEALMRPIRLTVDEAHALKAALDVAAGAAGHAAEAERSQAMDVLTGYGMSRWDALRLMNDGYLTPAAVLSVHAQRTGHPWQPPPPACGPAYSDGGLTCEQAHGHPGDHTASDPSHDDCDEFGQVAWSSPNCSTPYSGDDQLTCAGRPEHEGHHWSVTRDGDVIAWTQSASPGPAATSTTSSPAPHAPPTPATPTYVTSPRPCVTMRSYSTEWPT